MSPHDINTSSGTVSSVGSQHWAKAILQVLATGTHIIHTAVKYWGHLQNSIAS